MILAGRSVFSQTHIKDSFPKAKVFVPIHLLALGWHKGVSMPVCVCVCVCVCGVVRGIPEYNDYIIKIVQVLMYTFLLFL